MEQKVRNDYKEREGVLINNLAKDIRYHGQCFVKSELVANEIIQNDPRITKEYIPDERLYIMRYDIDKYGKDV